MNTISLSEASKHANITRTQARYWTKLLELKLTKKNRTIFLASGSEKLLEAMNNIVKSGVSPSLAAKEVLSIHALPVAATSNEVNSNEFTDRMLSLENAVMLLVEQNKALARTVENQSKQINKLSLQLKPAISHQKIKVWQAPEPQTKKISTFKRIWYEVISPEKLRAN